MERPSLRAEWKVQPCPHPARAWRDRLAHGREAMPKPASRARVESTVGAPWRYALAVRIPRARGEHGTAGFGQLSVSPHPARAWRARRLRLHGLGRDPASRARVESTGAVWLNRDHLAPHPARAWRALVAVEVPADLIPRIPRARGEHTTHTQIAHSPAYGSPPQAAGVRAGCSSASTSDAFTASPVQSGAADGIRPAGCVDGLIDRRKRPDAMLFAAFRSASPL